jgi:hypothetical protein
MSFRIPEISTEVMQTLRDSEDSTALIQDEFESQQPNIANGLKRVLADEGDAYDEAISYMALLLRAVELELERRLA